MYRATAVANSILCAGSGLSATAAATVSAGLASPDIAGLTAPSEGPNAANAAPAC